MMDEELRRRDKVNIGNRNRGMQRSGPQAMSGLKSVEPPSFTDATCYAINAGKRGIGEERFRAHAGGIIPFQRGR